MTMCDGVGLALVWNMSSDLYAKLSKPGLYFCYAFSSSSSSEYVYLSHVCFFVSRTLIRYDNLQFAW